jgi:NAD(P)-dependent dehydrogenase (short-subunit alcohol dehydrogenase family)
MVDHPSKTIFVTGASSGIGRDISLTLAANGHHVFAAARKEADLQMLSTYPNITPVPLDVRDPQQVQDALGFVLQSGSGLDGLVNNAGVGGLGFISTWTDEELFDIFDVNVFGPFRLTNALLPLLVQSQGRVVLIGSQGGMISKKYYGPYTMTKHALEAYSVALRDELTEHGIRVSIVQPGGVITKAGENAFPGMVSRFKRAQPPFKAEADAVLASFEQPEETGTQTGDDAEESETNRKPSPPCLITEAVTDALFSDQPKFRYLVGTHWEGNRVLHALVEKLLDENDNPVHSYSKDELIQLLKEKISERQ